MKFLLSLFTLIMTLNSCDSSKKTMDANEKAKELNKEMQETLTGTYKVSLLEKADVSSNKIIISFDESTNKVSGYSGCNSFFGSYTLENNKIVFSNLASSKKLCPNTIMTVENQFLQSLNSVDSFSTEANSISFLANDNIVIYGTKKSVSAKKSKAANYTDNTAVTYQAISRGSFDYISISKSKILISKDQNLQKIDSYSIDTKLWEDVQQLINAIDSESLQDVEAPSKKHQYDGAPLATLALIIGDVEYMTPAFDHGNPPEAIATLVNKVLSIKENTLKQ